jgi:hypothetical protein
MPFPAMDCMHGGRGFGGGAIAMTSTADKSPVLRLKVPVLKSRRNMNATRRPKTAF